VVVPLFDEERIVGELHRRLDATLSSKRISYEILFVNDGSQDTTPHLIDALHVRDPYLSVIHLSRNFGHQPAVSAGLDHARSCRDGLPVANGQNPTLSSVRPSTRESGVSPGF
jgi:polyisoprenyl-phosphate glycosyltransferase